nr:MAG TPA: hypothetical protein [Caudoviricetes sp.]
MQTNECYVPAFTLIRPLTPRRIRRLRLRRTLTRVFLTAAVATAALI